MVQVFRGKLAIPGDQIEPYFEALGQPRNFLQSVARQDWRKHGAMLHRLRAHDVGNGAFASGTSRFSGIHGNHRHRRIH
jgi:hypothetical protein